MNSFSIGPFLGAATALDPRYIQGPYASLLLNCRVGETGAIDPRYGYQKLSSGTIPAGFSATFGMFYFNGYDASYANQEGYVSVETVSSNTYAYSINKSTGARTELKNASSHVALATSDWRWFTFNGYAYGVNPNDSFPVIRFQIGTTNTLAQIKTPADPTTALNYSVLLPNATLNPTGKSGYAVLSWAALDTINDCTYSGIGEAGMSDKATSGSSTTCVGTITNHVNNEYAGLLLKLTGGTGSGQVRRIGSNDGQTFTVQSISLTVSNATNATPIVLTTTSNHLMGDGQQVVIASVGGTTAANGSMFVKVSGYAANQFALYSDELLQTPVAGNGAYTSGGTVSGNFSINPDSSTTFIVKTSHTDAFGNLYLGVTADSGSASATIGFTNHLQSQNWAYNDRFQLFIAPYTYGGGKPTVDDTAWSFTLGSSTGSTYTPQMKRETTTIGGVTGSLFTLMFDTKASRTDWASITSLTINWAITAVGNSGSDNASRIQIAPMVIGGVNMKPTSTSGQTITAQAVKYGFTYYSTTTGLESGVNAFKSVPFSDLAGASTAYSSTYTMGGQLILKATKSADATVDTIRYYVQDDYGANRYIGSSTNTNNSGTSTGSNSSTTLNDTGANWPVNGFVGKKIKITGGTGASVTLVTITANTATQVTVASWPAGTPNGTSTYQIYESDGVTVTPPQIEYALTWAEVGALPIYASSPFSYSNIKFGAPFRGFVCWGCKGGGGASTPNIRLSAVGNPLRLYNAVNDASSSDQTRPADFSLSDGFSDEPLNAFQCDDALLITGSQGIYAMVAGGMGFANTSGGFLQVGWSPTTMAPPKKLPGSQGCAGTYAACRWYDDAGNPGVAWLDPQGEVWLGIVSGQFDGSVGFRIAHVSTGVKGWIRTKLLSEQSSIVSDFSTALLGVDEFSNSLWIVMGQRAVVLRRPSLIDGQRQWELYAYTLGGSVVFKSLAFSANQRLRAALSDGRIVELEYSSTSSPAWQPITGTNIDDGSAMPSGYWQSRVFIDERLNKRTLAVHVERDTLTDTPTITVYTTNRPGGMGIAVPSGARRVPFPAYMNGQESTYRISVAEGQSTIRRLIIEEVAAGVQPK